MKLNKLDLDALREICNIGAGHASTALSEMTNKTVDINFPAVKGYQIEKIPSLIGKPEELVVTVYLKISGEAKEKSMHVGSFLLIFNEEEAINFANLVQNKKSSQLKELDKDALKETGNILSGACLNAISQFLDFKLVESLPDISVDMLNSTLDALLAGMAHISKDSIVFKTDFSIEKHKIKSYFLLFFDPSIYPLLLKTIKKAQNV